MMAEIPKSFARQISIVLVFVFCIIEAGFIFKQVNQFANLSFDHVHKLAAILILIVFSLIIILVLIEFHTRCLVTFDVVMQHVA